MISINIVKFFEAIKLNNFFYLHSMNYVFFLWTKPGQKSLFACKPCMCLAFTQALHFM